MSIHGCLSGVSLQISVSRVLWLWAAVLKYLPLLRCWVCSPSLSSSQSLLRLKSCHVIDAELSLGRSWGNSFWKSQFWDFLYLVWVPVFKDADSNGTFFPVSVRWSRMCLVSSRRSWALENAPREVDACVPSSQWTFTRCPGRFWTWVVSFLNLNPRSSPWILGAVLLVCGVGIHVTFLLRGLEWLYPLW